MIITQISTDKSIYIIHLGLRSSEESFLFFMYLKASCPNCQLFRNKEKNSYSIRSVFGFILLDSLAMHISLFMLMTSKSFVCFSDTDEGLLSDISTGL